MERIWETVRDRLTDLGDLVDDIESISLIERTDLDHGSVRLVNEWRSSRRIPELVSNALGTSSVSWIDTAIWDAGARVCRWSIEPNVLTEHIDCHGATTYESTMAGKGTRVRFAGSFDLAPGALGGLPRTLERPVGAFVESIVSGLIPTNTRKIIEGAAALVSERG